MDAYDEDEIDENPLGRLQYWCTPDSIVPGNWRFWPSCGVYVGLWVVMALVLASVGIPARDPGVLAFSLGCLLAGAVTFGVFWCAYSSYRADRERVRRIRASWHSKDPSVYDLEPRPLN